MTGFFKYFSLVFIFLIFSTYTPYYQNERDSFFFPIKKIEIEKNIIVDSEKLKNELGYLIGNSIFFINKGIYLYIQYTSNLPRESYTDIYK